MTTKQLTALASWVVLIGAILICTTPVIVRELSTVPGLQVDNSVDSVNGVSAVVNGGVYNVQYVSIYGLTLVSVGLLIVNLRLTNHVSKLTDVNRTLYRLASRLAAEVERLTNENA